MPKSEYFDLNQGAFRAVRKEVRVDGPRVVGQIPKDLNGTWIRNGANPYSGLYDGHDMFSWFSGDGMLHSLRIEDGEAIYYENRWVKTNLLAHPGEDVEDNTPANTNVIGLAGSLLALCEGGVPYRMSPSLETIGPYDLGGTLPGGHMSAHPKLDPTTGETVAFDYDWQEPYGRYFVIDASGAVAHSADINLQGPSMMHDFAVTASHSVFMDLPVVFDLKLAIAGRTIPYRWRPDYQARLGVLPRFGGSTQMKWFDIDPCFIFHTMNAFNDGDCVVLDAARFDKILEYDFVADDFIPDTSEAFLTRYTLNLMTGESSSTQISDISVEFPRVANTRVGTSYQYGYAVEYQPNNVYETKGLVRFDLHSGETQKWQHQAGGNVGEALYVPSENGAGLQEDAGYVLFPLYDANSDTSSLEIHDATDLAGGALASVKLPVRIPAGFHGNWFEDGQRNSRLA